MCPQYSPGGKPHSRWLDRSGDICKQGEQRIVRSYLLRGVLFGYSLSFFCRALAEMRLLAAENHLLLLEPYHPLCRYSLPFFPCNYKVFSCNTAIIVCIPVPPRGPCWGNLHHSFLLSLYFLQYRTTFLALSESV